MKAEILNAAYVRGYAERTGILEIPKSIREKQLDDLTEEGLEQLYAIGKKVELKMYRFKNHEDLPRVHKVLGFFARHLAGKSTGCRQRTRCFPVSPSLRIPNHACYLR